MNGLRLLEWNLPEAEAAPAVPSLLRFRSERGQVAQMVERSPEKAGVGGSIPSLATMFCKASRYIPGYFQVNAEYRA